MTTVLPALLTILYISASFLASLIALTLHPSRRPFLLVIIAIFAPLAFWRLHTVSPTLECGQVLGLFVLIWIAHISNVLCIEKYELPGTDDAKWRWQGALKMLFNGRWLGTPRQAPDVRERDAGLSKNQDGISRSATRHAFLLRRLFSLLTIYALHRLYYHLLSLYPMRYSDFSPHKQIYVRRLFTHTITSRETIIRAVTVFHFVFSNYTIFTSLHDLLSIFFVNILHLDEVKDWPPLFGSIVNAYTLRGFWGGFWHSLAYRSYTSYAKLMSRKFLGIPDSSMVGTVVIRFFVFFFSGVTHAAVSWRLGCRFGLWEEVVWFCGNFVALVVEDVVQRAIYKYFSKDKEMIYMSMATKWVGYFWVFGYFFWSLPKSHYPRHYGGLTTAHLGR
jgi:hypothetical protein